MKRIIIASLAIFASAAAFAQSPSSDEPVQAHHHNSSKHYKHHQKHHQQHASRHDGSIADRAVPIDSAPDFKP